jgi:aspartyl-tRNA(Asn)/glutamyl-tRNA(Gln) amidotransferase subunit A
MIPTILDAAARLRQRDYSAGELLEQCLGHIERHEPRVRAWAYLDRDRAREDAARADDELRRGLDRGPLHGIPVGIKDIIDVFDWPTACGSRRWVHAFARQDAPVVERLRRAGAVLVGKTITTQYASFDPPPTRNPWNLNHTPGGSSSGSAAAIAAGMCLATLGTQTGGSITRPAIYCGVAACKPSHGTTSTAGVLPLAPSMDHIGPMAQTVAEVAIVMQTIAEGERNLLGLQEQPPRLARPRGLFDRLASPAVAAMMDRVCEELRAAGASVDDWELPPGFDELPQLQRLVMAVEAAAYHEARYRRHPDDYEPNFTGLLEEGLACPAPAFARAKELQAQWRHLLGKMPLLVCPAATSPAPEASTTGDPSFNAPWSYLGFPLASFPTALADGLPIGIQIVGPDGRDRRVLAAAAWCERMLDVQLGTPRGLS